LYTYYLIDHNYTDDENAWQGEFGHLLAFNPWKEDAELKLTLFYEEREPESFMFLAPAGKSSETNYGKWPIKPGCRFGLQVESKIPIACQSTVGWNVTKNDYAKDARTKSPLGIRECAKSYMAIEHLSQDWYLPDGIVIDMPENIYVRESEWAVLLNPGDQAAEVTFNLHYDTLSHYNVSVKPSRLKVVYMDDIVLRNKHYGVYFHSDQPVAVQWLRNVYWYERNELMAYWSVPCIPGPLG